MLRWPVVLEAARYVNLNDVLTSIYSTIFMYGKCSESLRVWHTGVGGNVLINEKAARVGIYNVWDYAEGQDSYQSLMLVDLTQPPEEVSELSLWPCGAVVG